MAKQHVIESEAKQLLRSQQRHAGLLGRAVALTLVALDTRGHQVLRRAFAALCPRQNVVEREVLCMTMLATILAAISIANVNSCSLHRRFTVLAADMDIMPQPNNRGNRKDRRGRM